MGHEKALKLMGMALALYLTWIRRTGLEPREIMNIGVSFKISLGKFETQSVILGKYLLVKETS